MYSTAQIGRDFSHAAAQYNAHAHLQQRVLQTLLHKITLSPHALVLDAGCGTGQLAQTLSHKVIQLDIAYAMCAKAIGQNAPAINGTVASLPFADSSFDVVFSSLALQWVADWQRALAEMQRVLKPGGVLAVSTFGEGTLRELQESFAAVDHYPHVSPFVSEKEFQYAETITEHYPNLMSLMHHLKAIGARNKHAGRRRGVLTPRQLQSVEVYYRQHFGTKEGLPVTWKILYSVVHKS